MVRRTHRMMIVGGVAVALVALSAVTYSASAATQHRPGRPGAGPGGPGGPGRPGVPGRPSATPAKPSATGGASATSTKPPTKLEPDPALGEKILFTARVVDGVQTYTCSGGKYGGASVPEADLVGPRGLEIHHFAGPSWQSEEDGSLVTAKKVDERAVAGTIPELLLEVTSHSGAPNGIMAKVKHIQRLKTSGGTPDLTDECTDGDTDDRDYRATYVFWG
ncbi:hypothetical protein Val02_57820 [Virgisporangium aliadipatigenens]|uniref:DUF3455 domain-containing protein n=1 Tax=Virgisporangium aliadipatigenens TaxID=741659 RepID=A0A8J4DT62_9ACTN|nr:DUF3455 domain-containing protein [Virgisporangium aliadipatigenens]GIJ48896.1 hypothetical protein Val02_57820 [Virgisporangium aliadipatigenens]